MPLNPLKAEVIRAFGNNPSFLIINGNETYPVKNISFRGKDNKIKDITESFSFDTGLLFFTDIFDQPHCYINYDSEGPIHENSLNTFWF